LLQPFRRYDCWRRNWEWVMWPRPRHFWEWFVIQKLGFDTVYLCAKFDDSSFCCSRDIIGPLNLKWVTWTTPLVRVICYSYAGTLTRATCVQNLTTVYIASAVPDIWLVPTKIQTVRVTWPPPFEIWFAIHVLAHATINQFTEFKVYLHPLRSYDRRYKILKMGWFGVVRGHSTSLEIAQFVKAHTSSY